MPWAGGWAGVWVVCGQRGLWKGWDGPQVEGRSASCPVPHPSHTMGSFPSTTTFPPTHWAIWGPPATVPQTLWEFRPGRPGVTHFRTPSSIRSHYPADTAQPPAPDPEHRVTGGRAMCPGLAWARRPLPQHSPSACPAHPGCPD